MRSKRPSRSMRRLSLLVFGKPSSSFFLWLLRLLIHLLSLRRDTVNSVGLIPKRLPFTTSNTNVRTFRHAVALDERRAKFKANLWNRPTDQEAKLGLQHKDHAHAEGAHCDEPTGKLPERRKTGGSKGNSLRAMEKKYSRVSTTPTDIEEVGA